MSGMIFFDRWHAPDSGLKACVRGGDCDNSDVEDYLESYQFDWQAPPEDPVVLKQFCRNAFALKAALLVRRLGPDECSNSGRCSNSCEFAVGVYSKSLMEVNGEHFFAEFGVAPEEVIFALSLGCRSATISLQPAVVQKRKDVAIIAQEPLSETEAGPYAGFWQALYLCRQGYAVLLVGAQSGIDIPLPLRIYHARGQLQFSRLHDADGCGWLQETSGRPFHYVHFDIQGSADEAGEVVEALRCLGESKMGSTLAPPSYVSVQLPDSGSRLAEGILSEAMLQLAPGGHRRFKLTRVARRGLSRGALGAPIAELASDVAAGLRWRSAAEVVGQPLLGAQLHSTCL